MRVIAIITAAVLLLAGCGQDKDKSSGDPAACKAAMKQMDAGVAFWPQWQQDKSTRPEACQGLNDADFTTVATEYFNEVYGEFNKELEKTLGDG